MMSRVRTAWLCFCRMHLAALVADRWRTILGAIGVALGVTVVLGTLVLKFELTRPFDSFGPALTHAAPSGVVQVTPKINGRLPIETVDRLRERVADATAVIPVVAALTPVITPDGLHGFFLLGGSCQVELLIGSFDCERRSRAGAPAPGPGMPLQVPAAIAARHGLALGDELRMPGLPAGSAHVGWTFPEFDRVAGINGGYVAFAPSLQSAAALLSTTGYATAAFVIPAPGADITGDVDRVIDGVAAAGPPRSQKPAVLENGAQSFNLIVLCGVLVGLLIALNTILLAVEDRRPVLGTLGALGARPAGLLAGMLGEGVVIGLLGGLLGVPSGFLLGQFLVDRFGRSMLAGSGASIAAHFTPGLIGIGVAAGMAAGILAMTGPAIRLFRAGPLASMASVAGIQTTRKVPLWPLPTGITMIAGAVAALHIFQHGSLPFNVGIDGLSAGLLGVALMTVWLSPRGAEPFVGALTRIRPALGRLLGADIRRYAVLFAMSAAVLVNGTGVAIGSHAMQLLGTGTVAAQKPDRMPTALLIAAQQVLDQRDGHISDALFARIVDASGGRDVSARWRSTISSGTSSRLVIGVTPGDRFSRALYQPTVPDDSLWQGLRDGGVALSEIAAGRLRAAPGDVITLPTVAGPQRYRVSGVFAPRMIDNTAVGDIVLTSEQTARSAWGAVRDQVAVYYATPAEAAAHRGIFIGLGGGLSVYDDEQWRTAAAAGIVRFLKPFTMSGYVVMIAAGLSILNVFVLGLVQRRRERAALRAIGATTGQEQGVVIAHAAVLGMLVAAIGAVDGITLTYLWTMGSPVFYGIAIPWGVPARSLVTGVVAMLAMVLAAAMYPVLHARRLEAVEVLRGA